jgi:hypothetical protein
VFVLPWLRLFTLLVWRRALAVRVLVDGCCWLHVLCSGGVDQAERLPVYINACFMVAMFLFLLQGEA